MNNSFRKLFLLFFILIPILVLSQNEEKKYKEYSYTEFFEMIEKEKDTVFELKDALIFINPVTDREFLIHFETFTNFTRKKERKFEEFEVSKKINKIINLHNVQFQLYVKDNNEEWFFALIQDIEFLKPIKFTNITNIFFANIRFNHKTIINYTSDYNQNSEIIENLDHVILFNNCSFKNGLSMTDPRDNDNFYAQFNVYHSQIGPGDTPVNNNSSIPSLLTIHFTDTHNFDFSNNIVKDNKTSELHFENIEVFDFYNNTFSQPVILWLKNEMGNESSIINNHFEKQLFLNFPNFLNSELTLDYNQFNNNLFSYNLNEYFFSEHDNLESDFTPTEERFSDRNIKYYTEQSIIKNEFVYKKEQKLKAEFHKIYKENFDNDFANKVYIEIKDLETKRSKYLYTQNKNFETYFTWKINQFLKLFSAYGTKPSKAIIFSLWVIIFFAFIYLLFPNSWDTLGKKRLMHRFDFFQNYLRCNEGMHTLYLEANENELSSYEDFKNNLEQAKMELPKFFITWSKPLYNASMFSSRVTSKFLKKTDVLKGKWKDLTPKQKRWKNLQIGFLLTLGLLFDFTIKILNALMLSINTFTTLGFGEIPIKGIPRYLAILQGFIGWFMLTIFSVSLISQLLN